MNAHSRSIVDETSQDERRRRAIHAPDQPGGPSRSMTATIRFIEAEAKTAGARWAFLESGLDNEGAHAFFEREAYRPLSKVFGKRL